MENNTQNDRRDLQQPLLNGLPERHAKQVLIEDDDQDTFLQDAAVQGLRGKLQVEIKRCAAQQCDVLSLTTTTTATC